MESYSHKSTIQLEYTVMSNQENKVIIGDIFTCLNVSKLLTIYYIDSKRQFNDMDKRIFKFVLDA